MRIISTNDFDSASLTSAPACAGGAPLTNLQRPLRGAVARIAPVASWSIGGTLSPSGKTLNAVALCRHNLTGNATVRLRLYSDTSKTAMIYDSTAVAIGSPLGWGVFAWGADTGHSNGYYGWSAEYYTLWFTAVANAAAFTLDIADASNSDGYLEIGRIYLGKYWTPVDGGVSYGFQAAWQEKTVQTRMGSGSLRSEGYAPYRAFKGELKFWSAADRADYMALARIIGLRKDFFVSFYPGEGGALEQDHAAACKFVALPTTTHGLPVGWSTPLDMEEI